MTVSLITGCHRSGSTWLGKTICYASNSIYFWEPFNLNSPQLYKSLISSSLNNNKYWYPFLPSTHQFWPDLIRVCSKRRLLYSNISFSDFFADSPKRTLFALKKAVALQFSLLTGGNIVIKDPLMLFSVEPALESSAVDNVVILTRDPRAFYTSVKKANWAFDFSHLLPVTSTYPHLFKYHNLVTHKSIQGSLLDLESVSLLWNILHEHILYLSNLSLVTLFKYEDICADPESFFPSIAQSLFGNDFTFNQEAFSAYLLGLKDQPSTPEDKKGVQMVRRGESKAISKLWLNRISETESLSIYNSCHKLMNFFGYSR
ncbi:Hypothetical protein SynRCC307_0201 [Synechococcus sp. RCC307]|nr:Hypothetical protein SynRCC307_0201 [Synechococcus sp. RCC307]